MAAIYLRARYGPGPLVFPPPGRKFNPSEFSHLTEPMLDRVACLAGINRLAKDNPVLVVTSSTPHLPKALLAAAVRRLDKDTPVTCTPADPREPEPPRFFGEAIDLLEDHIKGGNPVGVALELAPAPPHDPCADDFICLSFTRAFGLAVFHAALPLRAVDKIRAAKNRVYELDKQNKLDTITSLNTGR